MFRLFLRLCTVRMVCAVSIRRHDIVTIHAWLILQVTQNYYTDLVSFGIWEIGSISPR